MFGQPRSKANTKEYDANYGKINWSEGSKREKPRRGVKAAAGGGWSCGLKDHNHDTFAQAAACVTGKGKP